MITIRWFQWQRQRFNRWGTYWAPGVLYRIALSGTASYTAGGTGATFTATGYDFYGSTVSITPTFSVDSGVGSINSSSGAYTPGTVSGNAVVKAVSGLVSGTEAVVVNPAAASQVVIAPSTVSVDENATQTFVAHAEDTYGNIRSTDTVTFSVPVGGGSVTSGGVYTAPGTAGSATVRATSGTFTADASVTVTALIDHITVTAASDSPTVATTDAFSATAYDAGNNPISGVVFTWSADGGTMNSSTGVLTLANTVGTVTGTATASGVSGSHAVTSVPDVVNSVTVSPSSATVVGSATQLFTGTVTDQYGNVRSDTITWSINGQNVPDTLTVSPSSVSVALNGTQAFSATVKDVYGNTISSPTVTWTAVHGSFTGSTYTAPASGTSDTVTGTDGAASGMGAVTLTGGVNLSSPTGTTTGATTASGTVSTDTGSGTLYWVASTSATPPSVAQIQLGHDQSGSAVPASGNQAVSATGSQSISATGLTAGTTYYLYYQQHAGSVDSTVVSSGSFTTVAIATLSSPTGTQTGSTTASGTVSTDQGTGTLYWVVSTSATPPSVAQIQLGHDSSGSTAAAHGSQSVSATGSQSISATGLTASTTYYAYYQQNDSAGDSTVASSTSFTTASGSFTVLPGIEFRETDAYVTTSASDVTDLISAGYPQTKTSGDGHSLTFGWADAINNEVNRSATVDVRLAGYHVPDGAGSTTNVYRYYIDVPDGAGTYSLTLASGDAATNASWPSIALYQKDETTLITTITPATHFAGGNFMDANGATLTSAAWPGSNTALSVVLTSNRLVFKIKTAGAGGYFAPLTYLKLVRTA